MIGELRNVSQNTIDAQITLRHLVNCDPKRIAQVASNLVANAIKHGTLNQLIRVLAATDERSFELAVANQGEPIDPVVIEKLFQPFFSRPRVEPGPRFRPLYRVGNRSRSRRKDRRRSTEDETALPFAFRVCSEVASPARVPLWPAACAGSPKFQLFPRSSAFGPLQAASALIWRRACQ